MYAKGKGQQQPQLGQQVQQQPPMIGQPQPPPQAQQQQPPQGQSFPAEMQAKEKLALYVYEYLVHMGAKNSAQTFLSELRWEKSVQLSEAPGFLLSWWYVFWDLYCAATPDRRDQYEPSNEAKAFHDYSNNGMINQQTPTDPNNMQANPNQMMNPNNSFFAAPGNQNPNIMNSGQQQFQRFHPGGQRPMRMNMDFPGANPNSNQMNPDQSRVTAGSRLTPPGNRMPPGMGVQGQPQQQQVPTGVNQISYNGAPSTPQSMRGPPQGPPQGQQQLQQPNQASTPGIPNSVQQMTSAPMSPMSFQQQQQQQQSQQQQRWTQANPNTSGQPGPPNQQQPPQGPGQQQSNNMGLPPPPHNINYTSASPPINYTNVQMGGHPGTPGIISSPQDNNGDMNFNNMMKNVQGGIQYNEQNLAHMVSINTEVGHHSHLNNEIIDSIKHSPIQNMQTNRHPDQDHQGAGSMGDLNSYNHFNDPGLF